MYQCDRLTRKLISLSSESVAVNGEEKLTQNLPAADDRENRDLVFIRHFPVQLIGERGFLVDVNFQKTVQFILRVDTFQLETGVSFIDVFDYFSDGLAVRFQRFFFLHDVAEIRGEIHFNTHCSLLPR